ncbi:MAG: glycosyltransferase family 87 protein [Candidatus Dormibacteria bacterium]
MGLTAERGWRAATLLGLGGGSRRGRLAHAAVVAVTAGAALLVLIDFILAPLTGHFTGRFEDFAPILAAGHAANAGTDPYATFLANWRTNMGSNLGFDYLPIVATLARPLAALPPQLATTLWLWGILGCTVTASVMTARTVLPAGWPRTAIGLSAAVLFAPALYNIWNGQMNAVVLLSLGIAFWAWVRGDEVTCGLALGFGGVAKLAPAALLLLLLARRWWRGAAAGAAVGVLALLAGGLTLGVQRSLEWITQVLPALERADGWYFNQSFGGLISRVVDHSVWHVQPTLTWLQVVVTAASAACLLGAAAAVRIGDAGADRRALEFSAGVVAMVLAGSVGWWDDYASLLIPLLVIAGLAARRSAGRPLLVAGGGLLLVVGVAYPAFLALGGTGWLPATFDTAWWWPALQLDSLPAWTALLALVVLVVTLVGSPTRSRPRGGDEGATAS